MKNIVILTIPLILLMSACASLEQQNALTQETIMKPTLSYDVKKADMTEIPEYDESECYKFDKPLIGFGIEEVYNDTTFIADMYQGQNNPGPGGPYYKVIFPKKGFLNIPSTSILVMGMAYYYYRKLPTNMCVKRHGTALSKHTSYWRSLEIKDIEIIEKRKLTAKERKELLEKIQEEYTEEFNKCNSHYQKTLQIWDSETSARTFCNEIRAEWMQRECRFPLSSCECINLAAPFAECYKKELIKLSPEYIKSIS